MEIFGEGQSFQTDGNLDWALSGNSKMTIETGKQKLMFDL